MKSHFRGISIICGFYDMYRHSNAARSTISWRLIKLARSAWAQILLAVFIGLGVALISLAQLSITGYAIGQMFSGASGEGTGPSRRPLLSRLLAMPQWV